MSDIPDRTDPAYWRRRPKDHGTNGLYREGPQEATNPLARLIPPAIYTDPVPPPHVARRITQFIRDRAKQLLVRQSKLARAFRGERVRTTRPRTHAPAPPAPQGRPQPRPATGTGAQGA